MSTTANNNNNNATYYYGSVPSTEPGNGFTTSATMAGGIRNKQGHSCCGGCCDTRRAVIIVDILVMTALLIDSMGLYSLADALSSKSVHTDATPTSSSSSSSSTQELGFDDDESEQVVVDAIHYWIWVFLLEVVLLGISLWGAITFSAPKVAVGLGLFGTGLAFSLAQVNLISAIMSGLCVYPHYFLFQEIRSGIMSKENYYNEEQSCCCV